MQAPGPPDLDLVSARRLLDRLRAFGPAEWRRVSAGFDAMRGDAIGAVWRRGGYRALWTSASLGGAGPLIQAVFTAGLLRAEFRAGGATPPVAAEWMEAAHRETPGWRERKAFLAELLDVAQANVGGDPIAVEGVLILGHTVMHRRKIRARDLSKAFGPFASVLAATDVLRDGDEPAV